MKKKELEAFSRVELYSEFKNISFESFLYFIILAELKNFSLAANKLSITQQAISKDISKIEEILDVKLINRKDKKNFLTTEGLIFLDKSKKIIEVFYDIKNSSKESKNTKKTFKIIYQSYYTCISEFVKEFMIKNPDINLEVYSVHEDFIEEMILSDNYDIAFDFIKPKNKNISYLAGQEIKYVIASSNPEEKEWNEIKFIKENFLDKRFISEWDEDKFPINSENVSGFTNSLSVMVSLCKMGLGDIYLHEKMIEEQLQKKELYVVTEDPSEKKSQIFLIWKSKTNNQLVKDFIEMFKNKNG